MVARLGGLPADALEGLRTDLEHAVTALEDLQGLLREARAELVATLHTAVGGADPDGRRILLAAKRAAFNGRSLSSVGPADVWRQFPPPVAACVERVRQLEVEETARRAAFAAAHRRALDRNRRRVLALSRDGAFRRGLALASPGTYSALGRHGPERGELPNRRRRRLTDTLLRYLSRAATKPSPFSTFTPVAFAGLLNDGSAPRLSGRGVPRSLLRLKRHILDQLTAALLCHRGFRARLPVVLNDSFEELPSGTHLFLRPAGWRLAADGSALVFRDEAVISARLGGPLILGLRTALADGGRPLGALSKELASRAGGIAPERVADELERLLDLGFLIVTPPWDDEAPHFEAEIAQRLAELPCSGELAPLVASLHHLSRLEHRYLEAADPAAHLAAVERALKEAWEIACHLGGLSAGVPLRRSASDLYEDVLVSPESARAGPVVEVGRDAARAAVAAVEPLMRLSLLFDPRQELRLSLEALVAERWPGRREIGVLELFRSAQALWRDYLRYRHEHGPASPPGTAWNPLGLATVADLEGHRQAAWAGLSLAGREAAGDLRLAPEDLKTLLAGLPSRYTEAGVGAALFLEPLAARGWRWLLTDLKEGTGRYSSRHITLLDEDARSPFASALAARGTFEMDGETVQLLDLHLIRGDTLNVHATQTPRVLVLPGASSPLPAARRRSLADLRLARRDDGRLDLRDRRGQRFLPVHLGVAAARFMSPVMRFLSMFGPSEVTPVLPPPRVRRQGGVRVTGRCAIGDILVRRQSWTVAASDLLETVPRDPEDVTFAALFRWRRKHGIPGRFFYDEPVHHPHAGRYRETQLVDLSSPLFAHLFRSAVEAAREPTVTLFEALPAPTDLPRDGAGRPRIVELLIESISLRPPYGDRPVAVTADVGAPDRAPWARN